MEVFTIADLGTHLSSTVTFGGQDAVIQYVTVIMRDLSVVCIDKETCTNDQDVVVDTVLYLCDTRDVVEVQLKYSFCDHNVKGSHVIMESGLSIPVCWRELTRVGIRVRIALAPWNASCRKPTAINMGLCIAANAPDQMRELLEHGANPNGKTLDTTHLHAVIAAYADINDHALLDVLLHWPGVAFSGYELIHAAVYLKKTDRWAYVVRASSLLLHNVDNQGWSSLHWLVCDQIISTDMIEILLRTDCLLALTRDNCGDHAVATINTSYHWIETNDLLALTRVRARTVLADILSRYVLQAVAMLIVDYL
jgi:hypothetical protein